MRLAVLSRKPSPYTARRFAEVARRTGRSLILLDPLQCSLTLGANPSVVHHGKIIDDVAVVLARIGNSIAPYGVAVLQHFELMGARAVNPAHAIEASRDKFRCLQLLTRAGLRVPDTVLLRSAKEIDKAAASVGGFPLVLKLPQGTQGIGVALVESPSGLESMAETLWELGQPVIIQRYIRETRGRDVRAVVVGGRVVAAMQRTARPGEFRANIHRGALGTAITLPAMYCAVAVAAAQATGLVVAGVDLFETQDGPLVLEVNSSPGLEGIERATGADVAGAIVEHAFSLVERTPSAATT